MLLRRYGETVQSVELDFDPLALTEFGFRRDREFVLPVEQFEADYEKLSEASLAAEAEGAVQTEVEKFVVDRVEASLREMQAGLGEGELLLVESTAGVDFPKLRERKHGIIVEGENRIHFRWWVDPPLRVGLYRKVAP